jgi:heterodisulfide reductase subunit A-like polyferredoxin
MFRSLHSPGTRTIRALAELARDTRLIMVEVLTPDICVIGAGSGGLSVAAGVAAFGVPVVLVEKGKMGGECLHTGCVPSKSLIAAARHAHAIAGA